MVAIMAAWGSNRPALAIRLLLLLLLFAITMIGADMHDVLELEKLPPAECPHGCANWAALRSSGNRAEQYAVDRLWQHGRPPARAGSSCAQPGRAVNFTGISTFTPLQLCPLTRAPPQKGEKMKKGTEPYWGAGNCSQAGFAGAFCLCAGAQKFDPGVQGAAAGWGYCRSRANTPEQINLQLSHSGHELVASFVTFPVPAAAGGVPVDDDASVSTLPLPEVQYWAAEGGGTAKRAEGVTRHWASPAVDYALSFHKPAFNSSLLQQAVRQYYLHFVKLPRLPPGTRTNYRVRCNGPWSSNFSVVAPPRVGSPTAVAIFGDMGPTPQPGGGGSPHAPAVPLHSPRGLSTRGRHSSPCVCCPLHVPLCHPARQCAKQMAPWHPTWHRDWPSCHDPCGPLRRCLQLEQHG